MLSTHNCSCPVINRCYQPTIVHVLLLTGVINPQLLSDYIVVLSALMVLFSESIDTVLNVDLVGKIMKHQFFNLSYLMKWDEHVQ